MLGASNLPRPNQEEIDNHPAYGERVNIKPGFIKYKDISGPDGVPDGVIDGNDRTVIGTYNANPVQGHRIEVDYLGGDVTVRIGGVVRISASAVPGPVGNAGRFVGIQTERTGNVLVAYPSPWLGPWSARDLPQDTGGDDGGEEGGEGPIVGG